MSDFAKELEGKAYQLVNGLMELDEFKSWFTIAQTARAPASSPPPADAPAVRKAGEFSDYYGTAYEPMDASMEAHHRNLMGEGEP